MNVKGQQKICKIYKCGFFEKIDFIYFQKNRSFVVRLEPFLNFPTDLERRYRQNLGVVEKQGKKFKHAELCRNVVLRKSEKNLSPYFL